MADSDPVSRLRRQETFGDLVVIGVALGAISVGLIGGGILILWLLL